MMDADKREALEAAGFRVGDAGDFLGPSDEERRLVELRVSLARSVRRFREAGGLSQRQLAARIGSSQSRVAKIEAASPDVSLDLMFRGLFAAGGSTLGGPAGGRSDNGCYVWLRAIRPGRAGCAGSGSGSNHVPSGEALRPISRRAAGRSHPSPPGRGPD